MLMDCILAGVGGQGTVLASKLLAGIGMEQGLNVRTAETIGMAQRGGSVMSHVRMGNDIASPLIPLGGADLLIGFEPGEAVRHLNYLKPQGVAVVSTMAIDPVTASLGAGAYSGKDMVAYLRSNIEKLITVDAQRICAQAGTAKVLNIALLGAAVASGALTFSSDQVIAGIKKMVKPEFTDINIAAFHQGLKAAEKTK
ncbi:MAG: indolepyruvate oxidoreductase subunit beta [Bacillota bacterium]|nr:indolepyruvate oxidoreductase subunit beta [Bacillota bacterium]